MSIHRNDPAAVARAASASRSWRHALGFRSRPKWVSLTEISVGSRASQGLRDAPSSRRRKRAMDGKKDSGTTDGGWGARRAARARRGCARRSLRGLSGIGARALARYGPARRLDPAVAVHAALGAGPDRRTHQGQLPAVCRTPIGRGAGQDLTNGHLRWDRPERRPLVAEPLTRGAHRRLRPL